MHGLDTIVDRNALAVIREFRDAVSDLAWTRAARIALANRDLQLHVSALPFENAIDEELEAQLSLEAADAVCRCAKCAAEEALLEGEVAR